MGLADRLQLKPGSVPTIYIICEDEIKESKRAERMNVRKNKNMVCNLLEQINVLENETTQFEVPADVEPEKDWKLKYDEISSINYEIQLEIEHLNTEMKNFKSENGRLLEAEISYNLEIDNLKKELTISEFHRENLNKLLEIFTVGQIKNIKVGSKRLKWTEADVARSITFYAASPRAYKLLRQKQFPLPCVRTQGNGNNKAQKINISTGIINPV